MDIFRRAENEAALAEVGSAPALFVDGMLRAIKVIREDFKEAVNSAEWAPAC